MPVAPKPSASSLASSAGASSSKPLRTWVPKACDRCRKRKARCDEAVPCRNCSDAGAECTHLAPVLKRGPRPRPQTQDLENRLKSLEHLIASIPAGSTAASSILSSGEVDAIRSAARVSPPSDSSPYHVRTSSHSHSHPQLATPGPDSGPGHSTPVSGIHSGATPNSVSHSTATAPSINNTGSSAAASSATQSGYIPSANNNNITGSLVSDPGSYLPPDQHDPEISLEQSWEAYPYGGGGGIMSSGQYGSFDEQSVMQGYGGGINMGMGQMMDLSGPSGTSASMNYPSQGQMDGSAQSAMHMQMQPPIQRSTPPLPLPQAPLPPVPQGRNTSPFAQIPEGYGRRSGYNSPRRQGSGGYGMGPLGNANGATSHNAGRDILYKDSEGQTKWLGPSSGMPLLDRLKIGSSPSPPPHNQTLFSDDWLSLSASTGLEVNQLPFNKMTNAEPSNSGLPSKSKTINSFSELHERTWLKLLEICSEDLVENLVRAYFTISYLLWPILHAPTFMVAFRTPENRLNPSFVALVLSICSLSSRYAGDPRLSIVRPSGVSVGRELLKFAKETISAVASERSDVMIVQALFNMSVVQEGTSKPSCLWTYLSQAMSQAIDLGLHRRVDDWRSFSAVDIEVRKRTMWAVYCMDIKASCTYGRLPLLRLVDIDLDEPAPVDDVFISVEGGIGNQPPDQPSVVAGFVAAVRLHMILERTIRRINRIRRDEQSFSQPPPPQGFADLLKPVGERVFRVPDETSLLTHVTDDLPGDWAYSAATIADHDSVRFFAKTRVFAFQHFIKLLQARHAFSEWLSEQGEIASPEWMAQDVSVEQGILQQITQWMKELKFCVAALAIIGTYCAIDAKGRLGFFGAHAIAQLSQAGAGLIGVILHLRSATDADRPNDAVLKLSLQGLPAGIQVLRQLGKRRTAGLRAAEVLAEFSRACRIQVSALSPPALPDLTSLRSAVEYPVEVPMLRTLPRKTSASVGTPESPGTGAGAGAVGGTNQGAGEMEVEVAASWEDKAFNEWLAKALEGSRDNWMSGVEGDPLAGITLGEGSPLQPSHHVTQPPQPPAPLPLPVSGQVRSAPQIAANFIPSGSAASANRRGSAYD